MLRLLKTITGCVLVSAMGACSLLPDHRTDYKNSTTEPPLEIPPDLIGSTKIEEKMVLPEIALSKTGAFSDDNNLQAIAQHEQVLPLSEKIQIKRDGKARWLLIIEKEPEILWSQLKQFWLKNGFSLKIENADIGIMETEWAEIRGDVPETGIRKYLNKWFDTDYSTSIRSKFRVRLERGNVTGITELYLTHRGVQEVVKGDNFVWQNYPSDSELEAEILNRIMVFIDIDKTQADQLIVKAKEQEKIKKQSLVSRANLTQTQDNQFNLIVQENFSWAWRHTGIALDRLGFTVTDRDRSRGIYFIRYIDPEIGNNKGFFSGLFSRSQSTQTRQEYAIKLIEGTSTTRIVILNNEDQVETSKTAKKILTLLQEQLQ